MKHGNLLYTFTENHNYHNPLVIDYLIEAETKPSEKIVIIGLFNDEEDIVIPEFIDDKKVVAIDENAFSGYTKLKSITIPKTIERVASSAFSNTLTVKYKGLKMSVQNFFINLKKQQQKMVYIQLQGFAFLDKNKRWLKSINIVKKSKDRVTAQQSIVEKLGLSDYQANVYLDCKIADIAKISCMNINEKLNKFRFN